MILSIVFVVLGKHFDCVNSVSGGNMNNDDNNAATDADDIFNISGLKYSHLPFPSSSLSKRLNKFG